ncbi:Eco57I restriction-modification methylase domain-containing protein [Nocardiopsis dassonvillei]|uniref:Eco57I restriction-modification methylase domain-containing protein n=1 Tax=Nocardiopsis dassonvillei TaxID=2014 RepID=UPI000B9D7CC4|nr:restriction endonuclease [Nocardiopsis dassonvillei]ASU59151.1 restriction endonuclease [Nocardiopsis dassonvillei]
MGYDSLVNRGEYFSAHYLAEVLPKHLKGKEGPFKEWAERESAENKLPREERSPGPVTPRQGLRQLKGRYFADRQALADFTERLREGDGTPSPAAVAAQTERLHALHRDVLTALGFTPKDAPAESLFEHGDQPVPVRLALHETTVAAIECGWAPDTDAAMDPDGAGWLLDPVDLGGRKQITLGTKLVSWLFARDENLRYVLVLAGGVVVLADRSVWGEGRYLALSLDTALGRGDNDELGTIAALFGAQALLPSEDGGAEAIATLVDASRQHAVGVSKELREGLQRSVEIIANEVLARLRDQGVDPERIDTRTNRTFADELARQSLRYLYRILFLLYAEARPELGVVPAKDEAYVRGYSMARLGDLVVNDLVGEEARNSTHLYQSLDLLFRMVNEGHNPRGHVLDQEEAEGLSEGDGLRFEPLRADLFDPERTRLIGTRLPHPDDDPDEPTMEPLDTRLRNEALHQVLRRLMISRGSRRGRGGFISYAQLGINQLGAVYEGLMSYTGFIAKEELYEAAKNGDPSGGSWMVPHSKVDDYSDDVWVRVKDENGKSTKESPMVVYKPGSFVYRLAGRDRETSASYYTPESLTQLTVQLTLRERLDQDGTTTPAKELLEWTICEPALGSGAFLNEAINQVAAEYLKRAQAERGEELDPERYAVELQKVKAYIALHRAYGVDLNGTAVELAEVSLWLNVMYPGLQAPWFGLHLRRGNSLIGAGRRLYDPETVKKGEWLKSAPVDQPFRDGDISEGYIHHFLLPAQGWGSVAAEKEAKNLAPEDTAKLAAWRRAMRRKPKTSGKNSQFRRLQALSRRAEFLWGLVIRRLELSEREISRRVDVYGADWIDQPEHAIPREEVLANLTEKGTPYWRLKTLMDAWCALWFWPVQKAGLLDGSDEVYERLERSLEASSAGGNDSLFGSARESLDLADLEKWLKFAEALLGSQDIPEGTLFSEIETLADLDAAEDSLSPLMAMKDEYRLGESFPWLHEVESLAERHGFFHWELQFAHLFKTRGGFDIQVGNPPWVRPNWDEDSVLAEFDPWFKLVNKPHESAKHERKCLIVDSGGCRNYFLDELAGISGISEFLSDESTYSLLSGTRPDLYRAFMCRAWSIMSLSGGAGLVHPDSHFSGVKEGALRGESYRRLRLHGHFYNRSLVFPEIHANTEFGIHVYGPPGEVDFLNASWLFSAQTLDLSIRGESSHGIPGIKHNGNWDARPHVQRIVKVDEGVLADWMRLTEPSGASANRAQMLRPVTSAEAGVVAALSSYGYRLGESAPFISSGYNETNSQKNGIIKWDTKKADSLGDVVLQGPHFSQGTPYSKQPNIPCKTNRDWSAYDLTALPGDAIPVCNYGPTGDRSDFWEDQEVWAGRRCTSYYRVVWRDMVPFDTERSLFAALISPGPAHVHAVRSMWVRDNRTTVLNAGFWSSLPLDYLLRITGRSHLQVAEAHKMPAPTPGHPLETALLLRAMRLNCLTNAYAPLWFELYNNSWRQQVWAVDWPRLESFGKVGSEWEYASPLRADYERRAALVELDALVSVWLGISADELTAVYKSRYPILCDYEANIYFDANGRKIAKNHNTYGYGQSKEDFLQLQKYLETGDPADVPEGYSAPFYKADREREYREAHAHFTEIVERAKRDGTWDGEV